LEKLDPEKINPEIPDPKKINREPSEDIARQAPPAKDVPEATENTKPAQRDSESVETPKEKIRPGKTPKLSLKGFYTLRAGAFSERKNADKMVASLNKSGFEAFIRDESRRSEIPYRVYIGRFKDRDDAYEAKARLENIKGLKTILLKL
jgi:cell division septation protein DedD